MNPVTEQSIMGGSGLTQVPGLRIFAISRIQMWPVNAVSLDLAGYDLTLSVTYLCWM